MLSCFILHTHKPCAYRQDDMDRGGWAGKKEGKRERDRDMEEDRDRNRDRNRDRVRGKGVRSRCS